jgi:hypothetical protein
MTDGVGKMKKTYSVAAIVQGFNLSRNYFYP